MDALEQTLIQVLKNAALTFAIDVPWLLFIQNTTDRVFRAVQGSPIEIRPAPAVVVYIFLGYLAQFPKSALEAMLLGVAVYGVYDATNYATLKNYDPEFAIVDTLWGGILFWLVFKARKLLGWS